MKRWTTALVAILLMISLFAIPAFAAEANAPTQDGAKKLSVGAIIGICICAVVLIVAIVLCIKFRSKIAKFFRVLKGETKKIVWLPWDQTVKSTWAVLVVIVIFAVAICLLDFGLSKGYFAFIQLFGKA